MDEHSEAASSDPTARARSHPTPRRIGRDDELALLRRVIAHAQSGTGGTVLVEGEAGIGKTRIVEEAVAHAKANGFVAVVGTQDPIGANRSYGVLVDAMSDPAIPVPWPRRISDDDGGDPYETLVDMVQRCSAKTPLLVAIDNLHWSDDNTIQTLCGIARLAPQMPLVLVLTSRPFGNDERLHHLSRVVQTSGGTHRSLGPLDHEQVLDLTTEYLSARAGPKLSAKLAAAGGNPLFALELLQGFEEHGVLTDVDGTIDLTTEVRSPPAGLTILRRLSILPPSSLDVVRAASILGRTFTMADLHLVLDRSTDELAAAVDDAITAGVLAVAETRLRFRHDLVWELLYDDLPAPVRAERHLDAARALAAAGRPPDEVVDHLLLGVTVPDRDVLSLVTSTVEPLLVGSPGVALKLTDRALAVTDGTGDEARRLQVQHALALLATGEHAQGRDECRSLLDSGLGPPLRGRLRETLLASLTMTGRLDEAIDICETAMSSSALDDAERANVASSLAFAKLHAGQLDESIDLADFAAATTPTFEPAIAARAHTIKAHALSHLGRFSECVDVALTAIADLDERGSNVLHFAHAIAGSRMMMLDRFDEAHRVLERGRELYERHASVAALCQYHVSKGFGHFIHGDWDDAVAEFAATEDLADDGLAWPVLSHGTLALIAAQRGATDDARRHLDAVDRVVADGGAPLRVDLRHRAQAVLEMQRNPDGSVTDRVADLAHREWDALQAGSPLVSALGFTPQIARTLTKAGDDETATDIADALQACADVNPNAPSIRGAALLTRGIVTGEVAPMEHALDAYRTSGHLLARSFAYRTVAETLIAAGDPDAARPHLDAARALCDSVGAVAEAGFVEGVAAKAGVAAERPARRAVSGWAALTATETVVVDFLGRRLSNPEIAEAMHISRRTVESHVSSILTKLGVRSRIDVARLVEADGYSSGSST